MVQKIIDVSSKNTQEIMALTAYGENRGGGKDGLQSVLNVIMNRVKHPTWWGNTPRAVCLQPMQFDCWNPCDPNYQAMANVNESDPAYELALELAHQAWLGGLEDITKGACFYYAKTMNIPPYWAIGHEPCAEIAGQLFFSDIK